MPAWRVIVAWQKTMPRDRPTIRRWPIVWCVTQPSMRRSAASCAIPQTPRSNLPAIPRTSLTSTQAEMPSWTSPRARSAMEWVFAAWGATSGQPYTTGTRKRTTEAQRVRPEIPAYERLHFFQRFDFHVCMAELVSATINAAVPGIASISFKPSCGFNTLTAVAKASESIP